jgi:hypothetical protein
MFELVTLERDEKHLGRIRARSLKKFRENGNHQIPDWEVNTIPPGFYTNELCRLVHRCLDPNPANRPTQLELMDRTHEGLQLAIERAGCVPRVYFRDNEIDEMPLGDAKIPASTQDFKDLIRSEFVNPDLPKLKLPRERFKSVASIVGYPAWKSFYRRVNPHKRWFQPVGAPPDDDPPEETDDDDDVDKVSSNTKTTPSQAAARDDNAGNDDDNDSTTDDDDDEDQGPRAGRRQGPREGEQIRRVDRLIYVILQRYDWWISQEYAKKLLRRNDWDVELANLAFARKESHSPKPASNEDGDDDDDEDDDDDDTNNSNSDQGRGGGKQGSPAKSGMSKGRGAGGRASASGNRDDGLNQGDDDAEGNTAPSPPEEGRKTRKRKNKKGKGKGKYKPNPESRPRLKATQQSKRPAPDGDEDEDEDAGVLPPRRSVRVAKRQKK